MTNKQLLKEIDKQIKNGKSQQAIFDEMSLTSSLTNEDLANLISKTSPLPLRKKNKIWIHVAIIFFVLGICSTLIEIIGVIATNGFDIMLIAYLIRIAFQVFIILKLLEFNNRIYRIILILFGFAFIKYLIELTQIEIGLVQLIDIGLLLGEFILIIYLKSTLFPGYEIEKETYYNQDNNYRMRYIYRFKY